MSELINSIKGAFLHSFRIRQQMLEIELSNDTYEEIIFFIDCKISSSDEGINGLVKSLDKIDSDVSDITYFIPANNKFVVSITLLEDILKVEFSNGYFVYFHLINDYGEPLSISLKKNVNDKEYKSINL